MIEEIRNILDGTLIEFKGRINARRIPLNTTYAKPGDLVAFRYHTFFYMGLIVSIKRTKNGFFLSTRNNPLVCVLDISKTPPGAIRAVIRAIHKKRKIANYDHLTTALKTLFAETHFKTFNLNYTVLANKLSIRF